MLNHPTYDKLHQLKLTGMAAALEEQSRIQGCQDMTFEERLGLLVDREMDQRSNRKLTLRLKNARLSQSATLEDIDFRHARGLDRSVMAALLGCEWIHRYENCLVTGPTGVGKSFITCALANKACRHGYKVIYGRATKLFAELAMAKADGSFGKRLEAIAKCDLLVLDDWGLAPLTLESSRDFLEILEDRYAKRSTIVASQVPVDNWHPLIADPTLADAALDRLVHNAHRITLAGESMRKVRSVPSR